MTRKTIYFGYGSNLWLHQMELRCPTSKYLGVARLNNYKWIINDRGYANVAEVKDEEANGEYDTVVFGLVYSLKQEDEDRLDKNEGVPIAYTKEDLTCDFWASETGKKVDVSKKPTESKPMLVYIDRKRVETDKPKTEYIYRMNQGIRDAVAKGVPQKYVDDVMRKFIPAPEDGEDDAKNGQGGNERGRVKGRTSTEEFALRQALKFRDESGVFDRDD